jgi:glycosyltransferase involved in cell wall biosynthesis
VKLSSFLKTNNYHHETFSMIPKVNLIIPLYNESEVFDQLIRRLVKLMDNTEKSINTILVDDGSSDDTAKLIESICLSDSRFIGVILSRNFGHQIALTAGLQHVNAEEAIMVLDGDLQDPPEILSDFMLKLEEGYDVVYAVRTKRKEGLLKRISYKLFYRILNKISYADIPLDSGDFCLMSRRVVDYMNSMPEESRFLRGMRHWVGFKQIGVEYERNERQSGESKYSLNQLIKLAFNGIFNFSEFPIRILVKLGLFAMIFSIGYLIYTLIMRFIFHEVESGFTALLFVIILFGGIQLVAIGIIGEYILRIFFQVKSRPLFVIDKVIQETQS